LPTDFTNDVDDVEFTEFDAVLGVPLIEGMVDESERICILAGAPRRGATD
jgi:hypothetical protein